MIKYLPTVNRTLAQANMPMSAKLPLTIVLTDTLDIYLTHLPFLEYLRNLAIARQINLVIPLISDDQLPNELDIELLTQIPGIRFIRAKDKSEYFDQVNQEYSGVPKVQICLPSTKTKVNVDFDKFAITFIYQISLPSNYKTDNYIITDYINHIEGINPPKAKYPKSGNTKNISFTLTVETTSHNPDGINESLAVLKLSEAKRLLSEQEFLDWLKSNDPDFSKDGILLSFDFQQIVNRINAEIEKQLSIDPSTITYAEEDPNSLVTTFQQLVSDLNIGPLLTPEEVYEKTKDEVNLLNTVNYLYPIISDVSSLQNYLEYVREILASKSPDLMVRVEDLIRLQKELFEELYFVCEKNGINLYKLDSAKDALDSLSTKDKLVILLSGYSAIILEEFKDTAKLPWYKNFGKRKHALENIRQAINTDLKNNPILALIAGSISEDVRNDPKLLKLLDELNKQLNGKLPEVLETIAFHASRIGARNNLDALDHTIAISTSIEQALSIFADPQELLGENTAMAEILVATQAPMSEPLPKYKGTHLDSPVVETVTQEPGVVRQIGA